MGSRLKGLIGWDDDARIVDPQTALEQKALETFFQRLSLYREDVPNVITVAFSSKDPNKAAEIANAIADRYIASTIENKPKSTKLVGQWLQDRMTDLKAQSAAADRALHLSLVIMAWRKFRAIDKRFEQILQEINELR
jgi:polysaccharide biosynthesis transport protein